MLLKVTTLTAKATPGDASGAPLAELPTDNLSADQLKEFVTKRIGIILTHHHGSLDISKVISLAQTASARALNIVIPTTADKGEIETAISGWSQVAQQENLNLCFETTAALSEAAYITTLAGELPRLKSTLNLASLNLKDLSPADPTAFINKLKPLLDHAELIRVNEPSPSLPGDTIPLTWEEAMRQWRRKNKPGSTMLGLLHPENAALWPVMQDAWKASASSR